MDNTVGKVLRIRDDGGIPADNPFVGKADVSPAIFTLGHRDPLGMTVHPSGVVLAVEHGPNGGDELNAIQAGKNYGWPKVTFGRDYNGGVLSESPVAPDVTAPLMVWLPSIGPTGLMVYTGDRFPAWKNNIFVGSVRRGEVPGTGGLERVVVNEKLQDLRRETLLTELHHRIRDVRQGRDGLIYVLTDEDEGALLRLEPEPRPPEVDESMMQPFHLAVPVADLAERGASTANCWAARKGAARPNGWTSISRPSAGGASGPFGEAHRPLYNAVDGKDVPYRTSAWCWSGSSGMTWPTGCAPRARGLASSRASASRAGG